jgi:hypothetical protein
MAVPSIQKICFGYLKFWLSKITTRGSVGILGTKIWVRSVLPEISKFHSISASYNIFEQISKFYAETFHGMIFLCSMYALFGPITHTHASV